MEKWLQHQFRLPVAYIKLSQVVGAFYSVLSSFAHHHHQASIRRLGSNASLCSFSLGERPRQATMSPSQRFFFVLSQSLDFVLDRIAGRGQLTQFNTYPERSDRIHIPTRL